MSVIDRVVDQPYTAAGIFVSAGGSGKNSNVVVHAENASALLEYSVKKSMVYTHYIKIAVPVHGEHEYGAPIAGQLQQQFKYVPVAKTPVMLTTAQQQAEERLYSAKSVQAACIIGAARWRKSPAGDEATGTPKFAMIDTSDRDGRDRYVPVSIRTISLRVRHTQAQSQRVTESRSGGSQAGLDLGTECGYWDSL